MEISRTIWSNHHAWLIGAHRDKEELRARIFDLEAQVDGLRVAWINLIQSHHAGWMLRCLSLRHPLVVASPLIVLSLRRPLIVLLHQLVVVLPLAILSLCHPLALSSHQLVIALPLVALTPRSPLILLSRRLVAALPLDAPPSCCLVVSLYRLSLPCHASWLSHHHLLLSYCCTALLSSHHAD